MFDLDSPRARRRGKGVLRQLAAVVGLLAIAGSARAWDASTPPQFFPSPFDAEFFASVALQPDDGVIVAGTHGQPNTGDFAWSCKLVVARLVRSTGAVDWRTELDDCGDDETYAFNPDRSPGDEIVRVDGRGDAIVARFRAGGARLEVVKLDGVSGAVLWQQTVARPGERNPTTHALALDAAGDVIVGGGDGTDARRATDLFVAKLAGATGAELWRYEQFGPSDDDDARNRADAIAIDGAGDVFVHGQLFDDGSEGDGVAVPLVAKLAGSDGRELWRAADGIAPSADVTADDAGDVVVAGSGAAAKLGGSDGAIRWRTRIGVAAPATPEPYAAHVVLADDGTIAVAADTVGADGIGRDVLVTALDGATGALRWQQTLDGADTSGPVLITDCTAGVGLDRAGNVVVAATIVDTGAVTRPLVAAFDRGGGAELWRKTFAGTATAHAGAFGLVVDGDAAVVAGGVGRAGALTDGLVAQLATADGAQSWIDDASARLPTDRRGVWLDETAFDAAVDPRGDVLAVGQTWSGVEAVDFAVRKLDGGTGTTLWYHREQRTRYGRPFGLGDFALAERVASAPDGDAVLLSSRYPTAVVKVDRDDGREAWSTTVTSSPPTQDDRERPLAIDADGDVIVLGDDSRQVAGSFGRVMVVKKLSGSSGAEIWDAAVPARGSHSVALDRSGDVLALGQGSVERRETLLVKYDGTGGGELWRHRSTTTLLPDALAVDFAGDALVATRRDLGNGFALGVVVKLDGSSGDALWQSRDLWGATSALALDGSGDVLAAGNSGTFAGDGLPLRYQAGAAKLDGTTGATRWSRSLDDLGRNVEVVAAVADANGDLIVAAREVPGRTWLAGLSGANGTLLWTIALGDADTLFDVRALRLRAPGELVVAGGRAAPGEGFAFAVLGLDVPDVIEPPSPSRRTCVVRTTGPLRAGTSTNVHCTNLGGRSVPTHR